MITELRIDDLDKACVLHARTVPFLKARPVLEFKPGINILWGGNGVGKSTVLTALARMLHCEQSGQSVVTRDSLNAVFTVPGPNPGDKLGVRVDTMATGLLPVHDGQCVMHFDPNHMVGLICNGAAFDSDFFSEGVENTMYRGSSGQTTLNRLSKVLGAMVKPDPWPDIRWKADKDADWLKDQVDPVNAFLQGTIPKGQPTLLLDEPDRSLSMKFQAGFWHNLATRFATGVQVITATHTPFALRLPGVNYIDMTPGYLAECEDVVDTYIVQRSLVQGLRKTE